MLNQVSYPILYNDSEAMPDASVSKVQFQFSIVSCNCKSKQYLVAHYSLLHHELEVSILLSVITKDGVAELKRVMDKVHIEK